MKDYINKDNGDYYAWICLEKDEIMQEVPKHFPNSEGKTWLNYSTHIIDPLGNDFIIVGYRDENGNRKDRITKEEFHLWLDHFEGRNIWTLAEAREYMKQFQTEEL